MKLEAPAPVKPSSIQLPDEISGPCALLRTTSNDIDVAPVGKLIVAATGQPRVDVTVQIRRSKGLLAREIDADAARRIMPKLAELGAPAVLVPTDLVGELPPVVRAYDPRISSDGFAAAVGQAESLPINQQPGEAAPPQVAGRLETPWEQVLFISAARVRVDISRVEEEPLPSEGNMWTKRRFLKPKTIERIVVDAHFDLLIDICLAAPPAIARVRDRRFDLGAMQRQVGDRERMIGIAQQLRRCAPDVPKSRAFDTLFDENAVADWEKYTYLTPSAIDDHNLWLYNLAKLGYSIG